MPEISSSSDLEPIVFFRTDATATLNQRFVDPSLERMIELAEPDIPSIKGVTRHIEDTLILCIDDGRLKMMTKVAR